jgi:hypothetical protein
MHWHGKRFFWMIVLSAIYTASIVFTPLYFVVILVAVHVFRMPLGLQTGVGFNDHGYTTFWLGFGFPFVIFAIPFVTLAICLPKESQDDQVSKSGKSSKDGTCPADEP